MYRTSLVWLSVAAAVVFLSCQGMSTGDTALPGSEIYTLSSSQVPGKPSTIRVSVDIDAAKRDALKLKLGSDYFPPESLYLWLAASSPSGAYNVLNNDTFRSIYSIPLSADPAVLRYEAAFDLFDLRKDSNLDGLSWIVDDMFNAAKPALNLSGYLLQASDGWWSAGPGGYVYGLETGASAPLEATFRDTVPGGQGFSNCVEVSASSFSPILNVYGGYGYSLQPGSVVVAGDRLVISYLSDSETDLPTLGVSGFDLTLEAPASFASSPTQTAGVWQRQFTFIFSTGTAPIAQVDGVVAVALPAKASGFEFGLSSTAGKYSLSGLSYRYFGDTIDLLPGGTVDFEASPDWSYFSGDPAGSSWTVDQPIDRDPAVADAGLSSGKVLLLADPHSKATGSDYGKFRNDWVDIPVGAAIPSNGNLLCTFSLYCDLSRGDTVRVSLVKADGNEVQGSLFELDSHDETVINAWDPSVVKRWKALSTYWPGSAPAGTSIKSLRFRFASDGYLEGRGVAIDNVQLLGTR
ncbi:MAG: hypothetical protein ACOYM2_21765 [Rectinemataceae bacterium]